MSDLLRGEGDESVMVRVRRECNYCTEPARHKVTFLLENFRSNPASTAYRRDDCTWCSDHDAYACDKHLEDVRRDVPTGMDSASVFHAADHEHLHHMLLEWKEVQR